MESLLIVLRLERELESLKIENIKEVKYIDHKKRLEELGCFSRKLYSAEIAPYYRTALMGKCREYEALIKRYVSESESSKHAVISFILGIVSAVIGMKLRDFYKARENGRMERVVEMAYKKLREVDNAKI